MILKEHTDDEIDELVLVSDQERAVDLESVFTECCARHVDGVT